MSKKKAKEILTLLLGFGLLGAIGYGFYEVVYTIWTQFLSLDRQLAVGLLTAFTTVLVSTVTVMLGRYLERRREIESHFRASKIQIYDEFLSEFFKLFGDEEYDDKDLVPFLREWQRKMIVWGGAPVLSAYIKWSQHLKKVNQMPRLSF